MLVPRALPGEFNSRTNLALASADKRFHFATYAEPTGYSDADIIYVIEMCAPLPRQPEIYGIDFEDYKENGVLRYAPTLQGLNDAINVCERERVPYCIYTSISQWRQYAGNTQWFSGIPLYFAGGPYYSQGRLPNPLPLIEWAWQQPSFGNFGGWPLDKVLGWQLVGTFDLNGVSPGVDANKWIVED